MLTDGRADGRTDGRTENRTPISHPATSRWDKNSTVITSEFLDILEYSHRRYTNNDRTSQYNAQRYIANKKIKSNFVSLMLIIVCRDIGVNTSINNA